jgi:hypothetical protein
MSVNQAALKIHLRIWAKYAASSAEKDFKKFDEMMRYLTKEEMAEMLGYLSGYIGAGSEGKKLCLKLLTK